MAQNDFQVRWELTEPFNFLQIPRLDFILQDPIPTGWQVEFIPFNQISHIRKFFCRLQYHSTMSVPKVTAERVEIVVLLNHVQVSENRVSEYPFSPQTQFLLNYCIEIADYDDRNTNILSILIRIDLKRVGLEAARAIRDNVEESLLFCEEVDLLVLRMDIEKCLALRIFPTLRMLSRERREHFVHHCILQARWTNLFRVHGLDENSDSVNIDISDGALKLILNYMYSTFICNDSEILMELPNVTELFQVIYLYEIFHLYGALRQHFSNKCLRTMNYSDKRRIPIVLNFVRNIHMERHSFTFPIYVHPYRVSDIINAHVHTFLFTVHVRQENLAGPWLSYSVLSKTDTTFNVHVSLEVAGREGNSKYIHSSDYDIPGNARIVSGPVLFLGCPEIFSGHSPYPQDNEIRENLLVDLTFRYADRVINIWYQSIPNEITKDPDDMLSQHMMVVLRREFKTDLRVQVNSPGNIGGAEVFYPIHKAIFATRIPNWWKVVEPNLPPGANLPDSVRIRLSSDSFHLVRLYMYTGKMVIPETFHPEITSFANTSGFDTLASLISMEQSRSRWKNSANFLN